MLSNTVNSLIMKSLELSRRRDHTEESMKLAVMEIFGIVAGYGLAVSHDSSLQEEAMQYQEQYESKKAEELKSKDV